MRTATFVSVALAATVISGMAVACPQGATNGIIAANLSPDRLREGEILHSGFGIWPEVSFAECGVGAAGYGRDIADLSFNISIWSDQLNELVITAEGNCDTVLLVNDPTGQWHFDDDSGGNMQPRIVISNPPRDMTYYDVYVGSYERGEALACSGMITVTGS